MFLPSYGHGPLDPVTWIVVHQEGVRSIRDQHALECVGLVKNKKINQSINQSINKDHAAYQYNKQVIKIIIKSATGGRTQVVFISGGQTKC